MEKTYTIKEVEYLIRKALYEITGTARQKNPINSWLNENLYDGKYFTEFIKVRIYIPVDKQTDFWYAKLNGMVFNVKQCSSKGEMSDTIGTGKYDPQECYIVIDGEQKSNVILKQDCKII